MLSISKINIAFDNDIIVNGSIEIGDGKITSLIGESGSGKTTLLYLIGLISSNKDYEYRYDSKLINVKSDLMKAELRKTKIGYIFQDNNLNNQLSIYDNICFSAKIAGITLNKVDVEELLEYVNVDIDTEAYPNQLSGGERQRIAIACALAKDPDMIIADEPTSSLDKRNSDYIISIFKKIAHEGFKKVVIATHDESVYDEADVVYEIKEKSLVLRRVRKSITETGLRSFKMLSQYRLSILFFLKYVFRRAKKDPLRKKVVVFLIGIAITFTVLSTNFGKKMQQDQTKFLNYITSSEIFVLNNTTSSSIRRNDDIFDSFNEEDIQDINKINGIEFIHQFIEFRSYGDTKTYPVNKTTIEVIDQENTKTFDFNLSNQLEYSKFSIIPYFDWQNRERQAIMLDSNVTDGVYISKLLADRLGIQNLDNTKLHFIAMVPFALYNATVYNKETGAEFVTDVDISKEYQFEVRVKGILDPSVVNNYSIDSGNTIYMSYEMMREIQNESTGIVDGKDFHEWNTSALVIKVEDYSYFDTVKRKIVNINPNYEIISEYQDTEAMRDNTELIRKGFYMLSIIILGIIFSLMTVIYIQIIDNRKYEVAMLKANGLTKFEILKLFFFETIFDVSKIVLFSSMFMFIVVLYVNNNNHMKLLSLDLLNFFNIIIITFISMFIPTIFMLLLVNRANPDRIIRN
ncbi:ATP-binding cassette domain-containing protein [Mycoplasmatota bacterium]|nr:ATP-binding cassette domain-containing protein [Mycoplasmatota bacterium]